MRFMALPDEFCSEQSKIVILPIPWEKGPTFGDGAEEGPVEIIKASEHLEYYDDELDAEPFEIGIKVVDALKLPEDPVEAQEHIEQHVLKYFDRFVVALGGDHSITPAIIGALSKKHSDLSVLILDAHTDLRHSWNNSTLNHACVSRRIAEKHKVGIIGVRSMDSCEKEFLDSVENVKISKAYENKVDEILGHLTDTVFVSIDVDVFDPSFIRNTGTPEPGGLSWYGVLEILRKVFKNKTVVGADIVEFAPKENFRAEAFALAKLVYKIIGYKSVNL